MSHSIVISLCNLNLEINQSCDYAINQLEQAIAQTSDAAYQKYLQNHIAKVEKVRNVIQEQYSQEIRTNYGGVYEVYQKLDSLVKQTMNVINNVSAIDFYSQDVSPDVVAGIIEKHGVIAKVVLAELRRTNTHLTAEKIEQAIQTVLNEQIAFENQQELKATYFAYVESQPFHADLKFELKKLFGKISYQELNDMYAFVAAKAVELQKIDALTKNLFAYLTEKLGFKQMKAAQVQLSENKVMKKTYKFRNAQNNTIAINIYGDLTISYKLGNYVGHACEKTTDKILNKLKEMNYGINSTKVFRDISNAKPLYMAKKWLNN